MTDLEDNGWAASAAAWIADQGDEGDFGRRYVLDAPMRAEVLATAPRDAVDIGCGEGRFCRWMRGRGIEALGIDPTPAFIDHARARDPGGDYRSGRAEALELPDASRDLAVFYLTLIDIDDTDAAIAEAARVLRPGGRVLIANLQPYQTAARAFENLPDGARRLTLHRYLEEWTAWYEWRGIHIRNWHRPLSAYFQALLAAGLILERFDEPAPRDAPDPKGRDYNAVPYFYIMRWRKPG